MVALLPSLLGSLVLIFISANAYAEKPDYMKIIPECVHGDGGALCNGAIQRYHTQIAKKQLQREFQEVLSLIMRDNLAAPSPTEQRNSSIVVSHNLQAQQQLWSLYVDKECGLIGALSTGMSTWQSVKAVECERNLAEQRLMRVKQSRTCLEKLTTEQHTDNELKVCLLTLSMLAAPHKQQIISHAITKPAIYKRLITACQNDEDHLACRNEIQLHHNQQLKRQLQHQEKRLLKLVSSTHKNQNGESYLDDKRLVNAIIDQQKVWPKFVQGECAWSGNLLASTDFPSDQTIATCEQKINELRIKRLRHASACLERRRTKDSLEVNYEAKNCLFQLAPIAVPIK